MTPSLPDQVACREVDIVATLRPATAGDDKTLYVVPIDVGSDREPFCQEFAHGRLAGALVPGNDE